MKKELQFEIQGRPEFGLRGRRGLSVSIGLHLLLFVFIVFNPDFLSSTPTRIIRITGQDADRDRFELYDLILPPELLAPPPEPPEIAEALPPAIELPPSEVEATPPPPPPSPPEEPAAPVPPPPVIGPDDIVAEGARPDAEPNSSRDEAVESRDAGGNVAELGDGGDEAVEEAEEEEALMAEAAVAPLPDNTNSNALLLPDFRERAESIVEEQLERNRRLALEGRRPGVQDGIRQPDFAQTEPTILSDTRGYDFGPYMNQVVNRVRLNWYSLIPEAARLRQSRGRVVLIFTIMKVGDVADLHVVAKSGTESLDFAAIAAITASNPFQRLPRDFDDDHLVLQFTFLYNMNR